MGTLSIWHWLVILAIVLLLFGTKRLRNIGSDMGNAIKGFKNAVKDEQNKDDESEEAKKQRTESLAHKEDDKAHAERVIEGEAVHSKQQDKDNGNKPS